MSAREEQNGKFFMGNRAENLIVPQNPFTDSVRKLKEEKEAKELGELYIKLASEKQEELENKISTMEIMPVNINIIILPYPTNPYKKMVSKGGLLIGEYSGSFQNPDSGEGDTLNLGIGCAKVIEVGPACKYIKSGDDVFYDTRVQKPIPFMGCGYFLTNEQNIICVMNEGLTERFKNV